MRISIVVLSIMFGLFPSTLSAKEKESPKHKFGLVFPRIGVIWHINDRVALLPFVGLTGSWGSGNASTQTSSTNTQTSSPDYVSTTQITAFGDSKTDNPFSPSYSVGANVRFFLNEWKGVQFYVSPGYSYGHYKSEETNSSDQSGSGTSITSGQTVTTYNSESTSHNVNGVWGFQYTIGDRVGLFGDIGMIYSHTKGHSTSSGSSDQTSSATYGEYTYTTTNSSVSEDIMHRVGTAYDFGIILYIK